MLTLRTYPLLCVLIVGIISSIAFIRADDPVPLPNQNELAPAKSQSDSLPPTPPKLSNNKSGDKTQPKPKRPMFSKQQIAQLIEDIGSEKFAVRSAASAELENAGEFAVDPLTKAIESGDTEVRLRAFKCLESYFSGDDIETEKAAWSALEKLNQAADNKHVAARSQALLVRHGERRERLFFERIKELNGIVQPLPDSRVVVAIDSDWKGGEDGLSLLGILGDAGLPSVCSFYLIDGAPVSPKKMTEIEALLTSKQVICQTRGKASLGISGGLNFRGIPGCVVTEALRGKSAHTAGIRQNDVIVKFGGKPVEDFLQLVDLIRTYDVGAKVDVELYGGRSVEVTLQSWRATNTDPAKQIKPGRPQKP